MAADIDADGDLDVVFADPESNGIGILKNRGDGTFLNAIGVPCGSGTVAACVGDVDGDGDPDIVAANEQGDSLTVLRNSGGVFGSPTSFGTDPGPVALALSDVDGDGDADLAVVHYPVGTVRVFENNGVGGFAPMSEFDVVGARCLVLGDLDNDGDPDLVVGANAAKVFANDGTGSFAFETDVVSGPACLIIALADFDGDGQEDIATATASLSGDHLVQVVLRTPEGGYHAPAGYEGPYEPQSMAVGDLDGNGRPDLVVVGREYAAELQTFHNFGDGTFERRTRSIGAAPSGVVMGDLDGDGDADLAIADRGTDLSNHANHELGWLEVLRGDGRGGLASRETIPISTYYPTGIAIGDVDGDSDPDVVIADAFAFTMSGGMVVLRNSDGVLAEAGRFPTMGWPSSVRLADLDGDGDLDMVGANSPTRWGNDNYDIDSVTVLLNDGIGNFGMPTNMVAGEGTVWVAVGDMDGDGDPDIVAVSTGHTPLGIGSGVYVLRNRGDATFEEPDEYLVGSYLTRVALGDLDGDGDLDVVAADTNGASGVVLLNNGLSGLTEGVAVAAGGMPASIAIGDLNGDGAEDLVFALRNVDRVGILLGNGDGTFADVDTRVVGPSPVDATLVDYDWDGDPDIVAANSLSYVLTVVQNRGGATFGPGATYAARFSPNALAIADVDSDTDLDIVALCGSVGSAVCVLDSQRFTPRKGPRCPADIDGSATVDAQDFVILASHYGQDVPAGTLGDINGDGVVNAADFVVLAAEFGCGP